MLEALRHEMEVAGIQALWVTRPQNVRYLTGFTAPEDARVLILPSGALMYTDARYSVQAQEQSRVPHHIARGAEVLEHASSLVTGLNVGFEGDHLTVSAHAQLASAWQTTLTATSNLVENRRLRKSPEEVAAIREAARIADEAIAAVLPRLQAGARERDIALDLEIECRRRGGEGASFEFIVASGPRSAMPHGVASDRLIGEGDLVTIDFGTVCRGYHSDMTRAYPIGVIADDLKQMYRVVLEAHGRAIAAIRPGVRASDVDAAARAVIEEAGMGDAFVHSTGHGVGLAIHEAPAVSKPSDAVLEAGMVITVEPGVYFPGVGGVRIEDLVLVTDDGVEVLSSAPKATV
jgi:Xaa-Pro aminopeptidase